WRLTKSAVGHKLRGVKTLVIALCALAALVGGVGAVVMLTLPSRAEAARERLAQGADRFVECYSRDASYERCETGTEKLMVDRSKRQFTLTSTVAFGPTYTISGASSGRLERSCQPENSKYCSNGLW